MLLWSQSHHLSGLVSNSDWAGSWLLWQRDEVRRTFANSDHNRPSCDYFRYHHACHDVLAGYVSMFTSFGILNSNIWWINSPQLTHCEELLNFIKSHRAWHNIGARRSKASTCFLYCSLLWCPGGSRLREISYFPLHLSGLVSNSDREKNCIPHR